MQCVNNYDAVQTIIDQAFGTIIKTLVEGGVSVASFYFSNNHKQCTKQVICPFLNSIQFRKEINQQRM